MSNTGLNKVTKARLTSIADGIKYVMDKLGTIRFSTICRVMLLGLNVLAILFLYNVVSSQQTVEKIMDNAIEIISSDHEESIDMDIRDQVTPQISNNLRKLLYTLDADRSFVIELHNGKKNATSLPFKFFDMTYEEIHEERPISYISQNYIGLMVSHFKMPYYLVDEQYFIGGAEELAQIDPRLASVFEKNKGKYLGLILLKNEGKEIGFAGVSYTTSAKHIPSDEIIKSRLLYYSRIMSPLLDLGAQKIKLNIKQQNDSEDD